MMEAKDVARKATSGCSHIKPVTVTCPSCVESMMRDWEESIRSATKESLRDEWSEMSRSEAKALDEAKSLRVTVDRLRMVVTSLEQANAELHDRLQVAKKEVSEMRVQLHAEQAARQASRLQVVHE